MTSGIALENQANPDLAVFCEVVSMQVCLMACLMQQYRCRRGRHRNFPLRRLRWMVNSECINLLRCPSALLDRDSVSRRVAPSFYVNQPHRSWFARGFELSSSKVMNQLLATSEGPGLLGFLRRQQVVVVLRGATFIGALLLAWISLRPFEDLAELDLAETTSGNDAITYLVFGGLALLTGFLTVPENRKGLATLLTPGFLSFGGWIVVSVMLSTEPAISVKRFTLSAAAAAVASMLFVLPRSQSEMARWFSIAVLGLLATCYLGIVFVPNLSIHLATDLQEPLLAGDWRGVFGHKNVTAAVMVMMLFLGIYIMSSGLHIAGFTCAAMAVIFIFNAGGKSSLALCVVTIAMSSLTSIVRAFWLR